MDRLLACSPQLVEPANLPPAPGLEGNTLRQIVHLTLGGNRLRFRVSNKFGATPLTLSSVHIALPAEAGSVKPETDKALTFAGQPSVSIPAGAMMISDPIDFSASPQSDLAITLHAGKIPKASPATPAHAPPPISRQETPSPLQP